MKNFIIAAILFTSFNSFSMIQDSNNNITISRVSLLQMASANLCAQAREKNENKVSEYIGRYYVWGSENEPEAVYVQKRKNTEDFLRTPEAEEIFKIFVQQAKLKISSDASREERTDVVQFINSLQ